MVREATTRAHDNDRLGKAAQHTCNGFWASPRIRWATAQTFGIFHRVEQTEFRKPASPEHSRCARRKNAEHGCRRLACTLHLLVPGDLRRGWLCRVRRQGTQDSDDG